MAAPRPIWTGSISFGLVNIPIRLYNAVREQTIHFHLLHDQDHARLKRKLVCSADGAEVHAEHTVRGYEVAPEQYVIVSQQELDAAAPKRTRSIEIEDFVSLEEIDPVYFDRAYYLAPLEAGARAYRLLVEVMGKSKRIGVARFVMHNKERLAALRPTGPMLTLETMHFGDEVLDPSSIVEMTQAAKPDERELKAAQHLVDSLAGRFNPKKYHDDYRDAVMKVIERKAAGEQIVVSPQPKEAPQRAGSLLEALEASLGEAKRINKSESAGSTRRRRRSA